MIWRIAGSSQLGRRVGQEPRLALSWLLVGVLPLMVTQWSGTASEAAELAPLPAIRNEDPLQFRPQLRQDPSRDSPPLEGLNRALSPSGDPANPVPDQEVADPAGLMAEGTESWAPPRFFRRSQERFLGPGRPLIQESWSFRPFSLGGVFGLVQGSPLIDDWIRENQGVLGGVQFGWDTSPYWGFETRLAWAKVEVVDSDRAIAAQIAKDDAAGLSPDDPFRHRFDGRRYNRVFFWDAHALYYPWGDSAFRPYVMVGLGATAMSFIDRTDVSYKDTLFTLPFGLGIKYWMNEFLAARIEAADFMAFGGGQTLELIHNVTVIGGLEVRFGGPRRAYWPWNPGRHYW